MPRKPANKLAHKKKIEEIVNHETDGKCGVRFHIKWANFAIVSKERSPLILSIPGGRELLKAYLLRLQAHQSKRFEWAVQRQEDLILLLSEEPERPQRPERLERPERPFGFMARAMTNRLEIASLRRAAGIRQGASSRPGASDGSGPSRVAPGA